MSEPTNDPVCEKHVVNIGRWRVAFRFGRYRMGYHSRGLPHFTGALPFVWFSVLRRNRPPAIADARRTEEE